MKDIQMIVTLLPIIGIAAMAVATFWISRWAASGVLDVIWKEE